MKRKVRSDMNGNFIQEQKPNKRSKAKEKKVDNSRVQDYWRQRENCDKDKDKIVVIETK